MTALIDTSVLVGPWRAEISEPWVVSIVSVGELEAGVLRARDPGVRASRLRRLTADERLASLPLVRTTFLS